ncbi:orotidine-5'-phosphate decarboxylase [Candidatus Gracilibacteria bacterium]|nr:orotidine-5'-phosphate decarboxylase [Candidatus Gracilibacteria bacterium]
MAATKTSQHFADRLVAAIQKKGSPICMGLDPRLDRLPKFLLKAAKEKKGETLEAAADAIFEFNKGLIDATHDLVPVVKPQFAFYVQYGSAGVRAFEETCKYAQSKGLLVIADTKSNDIGSTAEAYAQGIMGEVDVFGKKVVPLGVDAVTVNPYLGYDGIKPFIEVCRKMNRGVFILVKTSNPSSSDLQSRVTVDEKIAVSDLMGQFVESWGADEIGESGYSSVGAVVGATFPQEAAKLRIMMPQNFFLVPGFGAQGGKIDDVKACFNEDGLGAIINSSREINFAWEESGNEKKYAEAAREVVLKMAKQLRF